jgi:hypothetical protein
VITFLARVFQKESKDEKRKYSKYFFMKASVKALSEN